LITITEYLAVIPASFLFAGCCYLVLVGILAAFDSGLGKVAVLFGVIVLLVLIVALFVAAVATVGAGR
jgi:hypothetical protein